MADTDLTYILRDGITQLQHFGTDIITGSTALDFGQIVRNEPIVATDSTPESSQPSLFLKAYAHALRPYLTLRTNLSASNQAIFVASPLQRGIPVGVNRDFSNEQLFQHANAVQVDNSPIFDSGRGDFFEWLHSYVTHVKDDQQVVDSDKDKQKEEAYWNLRGQADALWDKAVSKYQKIYEMDPTFKFQDFMLAHGSDYNFACKKRDEAIAALEGNDIRRAKQTFDSAQARLAFRPGSNMPCSLQEVNLKTGGSLMSEKSSANPIYRPLYYLSGYQDTVESWMGQNFKDVIVKPKEVEIDLKKAWSRSWSSLGYPKLDESPTTTNVKIEDAFNDCHARLSFTGIASFNVGRGLWNIEGFRDVLPPLIESAPARCRLKIYKTVKLLFAYGVRLTVTFPSRRSQADCQKLLPGLRPTDAQQPNSIHEFEMGEPRDNAYPNLLAVLAEQC